MLNLKTLEEEKALTTLDEGVDPLIKQVSYLIVPDLFSSEECDIFVDYVEKNHKIERGKLRDQSYANSRTSEITFVEQDSTNKWFYNRILERILPINNKYQKFELSHLDRLQYTSYKKDQYLKLHTDDYFDYLNNTQIPNLVMRKLSVSIGLNDEYEGGEFEIHNYKGTLENAYDVQKFRLPKGSAIVFPSFQLHQVYPVTEGIRKAVVAWFFGQKWK